MDKFTFYHPVKNYFGNGILEEALNKEIAKVRENVMVATYDLDLMKKIGIYQRIEKVLNDNGKNIVLFTDIMPNPTYTKVLEGIDIIKQKDVDFILALGGGSVIDCCKAMAAGAVSDMDVWEMKEKGIVAEKWVPLGVVLTVSGTGAEQTNISVITNEEKKLKGGMRMAYPNFSILDPEIVLTVPMKQVMSGAFDSLSHCMESYFSLPSNDTISDKINESLMRCIIENMKRVNKEPNNLDARGQLMWASGLAECGLLGSGKKVFAQCHQLEHQLAAFTDCNHGQGLAVIHPKYYKHVFANNIPAARRFAENIFDIHEDDNELMVEKTIASLDSLISESGLPTTFNEMKIENIDLDEIVKTCKLGENLFGTITYSEAVDIFKECFFNYSKRVQWKELN